MVVATQGQIVSSALTIQEIIAQKKLVSQCVSDLMKEGEHYGVIPGTEKTDKAGKDISKRVLFKSGADLLCSLFQLEADYETLEAVRTPTLIYYRLKCTLTSSTSRIRRGSGLGSCNSQEEKYVRAAARKCPNCGKDTIIKGREEYGGGWLCFAKKGGCGGKWKDGDASIEQQETGIKDPADLDNTILKMAAKRSRVDAVLTVTGASDFFTQDVEELTATEAEYIPPAPQKASADQNPKGERGQSPGPTTPDGPSTSASTSGSKAPTTGASVGTKPAPRANTVKHTGAKASPEAVKLLHTLRGKVGGLVVCDPKDPCPYKNGKLCGYHTQLAAFKMVDGRPCASSKELSPEQISNLIGRYEKKINEQGMRAANEPDLGAVIPIREPGSDDDHGTFVLEEKPTPDELADLETAAGDRWGDSFKDVFPEWLKGAFDYDTVFELSKQETADATAMIRSGR